MPDFMVYLQSSLAELTPVGLFAAFFLGTFVSEDATCLIAGTAVAAGQVGFPLALSACLLGIVSGDIALYAVGRAVGEAALTNRVSARFISEADRQSGASWLTKNSVEAVFFSRFVPGLRLPTYVAAGVLRADFGRFLVSFAAATVFWTPILIGSVAFAQGDPASGGRLLIVALILIAIRLTPRFMSWRSRRRLIGRIRRLYRWEFWPLPIFYIPVVCYIAFLAIRYRSATLFTAANPGMPAGGFVGESKDKILRMIAGSPSASGHLLRHQLVPAALDRRARSEIAESFLAQSAIGFPLVAKPDAGERGKGVTILRSRAELIGGIAATAEDTIIQEYCPGIEVSIFYYRRPPDESGHVFSLTEKSFPTVVGDGRADLETLILRDERAVCAAKHYIAANSESLGHILSEGERLQLIDIGTHSRGAVFGDGEWLRTPELESAVEEICRGIDGFFFGRFDVRASSFDDVRSGRFKIIELNGVTSESTNIYDPRYSLFDAYRILFAQWRLAFEIGYANRASGAGVCSFRALLRIIIKEKFPRLAARSGRTAGRGPRVSQCA